MAAATARPPLGRPVAGASPPDAEMPGPDAPSERALAALKPFAQMAWEECHTPLPESFGAMSVRWEIYSTWLLLLCLFHAEVERDRCLRAGWTPRPWVTEAQALRHLYLQSRTLRVLCGLLRWLRSAHGGRVGYEDFGAGVGDGRYDRTRRRLKRQRLNPPALALHPDGPLLHPDEYDPEDLEDEECLLQRVFLALRRGDLRGAMKMCDEGGQSWRTAFLLGMLPFADSAGEDSEPGYVSDGEDEMMGTIKEQHTDWTEVGAVAWKGASDGNAWRRIWKEQCWDTVQRQLGRASSPMSTAELGIYGFCAGRLDALLPACSRSWADTLWAELHCLKECFVERLLDARGAACAQSGYCLGEGDCGVPDPTEGEASRAARRGKLAGPLFREASGDAEAIASTELRRILRRSIGALEGSAEPAARFSAAQAAAALALLDPAEGGEEVLGMLRQWLAEGLGPGSGQQACPFAVKQFVSHFAIWQKDALQDTASIAEGPDLGPGTGAPGVACQDIDDLVREHVGAMVLSASGGQGLQGNAVEIIADHVAAMTAEGRVAAWAGLLLRLGPPSDGQHADSNALEPWRWEALKLCIWVFWGRFPNEAPRLLAVLSHRALQLHVVGEAEEEEFPEIGPIGVSRSVRTGDVLLALRCAEAFWVVSRDRVAKGGAALVAAAGGLQELLGAGAEAAASPEDFALQLLGAVVLPVVCDMLTTLSARAPAAAIAAMPWLEASLLWRDAFASRTANAVALEELSWFAGLCARHEAWSGRQELEDAVRMRRPVSRRVLGGFGAAPADVCDDARALGLRDELLDWARPRLAMDRALLEPLPGTHTTLEEGRWQRLSSTVASRTALMLLSVFEATGDLDGALGDLVVALARSPWLLDRLQPRQARALLERLVLVPTRSEDPRLSAAQAGGGARARAV